MAEGTMGSAGARPTLFLRNATGLGKSWSTFDAFVWYTLTISLGSPNGFLVSSLLVLAFVALVVMLGMEPYARIQKICFWAGLAGLAVVIVLLLVASPGNFHDAFNREATSLFGAKGDAYQQTLDAANKGGLTSVDFGSVAVIPTLLVLPFLAFYLLSPNFRATLYAEVRGSKDLRKPFSS